MSLTWFWCLYWWLWTGLTRCSNVALNKEMSAWLFCCSLHKIVREYKNTTRVDLPEVDFSFHEDNHKVKEMTEVTSRDHDASFYWKLPSTQIYEQKIYRRGQRKWSRAWETLGSHFLDLMVILMERKIHFR